MRAGSMGFQKQMIALFFTLLFCQSSHAAYEEDIIWGVNSSPPFHIFNGEYKDLGFCDALVTAFQRQLTLSSNTQVTIPSNYYADEEKQEPVLSLFN